MKPSASFKFLPLLAATFCAVVLSCNKADEIDFCGTVIDTRECTADLLRPNLGYLVHLATPDSVGADYIVNGTTYHNVVILYDPDRVIYRGDKLRGTFYFDDQYDRANCSIHWTDFDVPVGVFTSVTVD